MINNMKKIIYLIPFLLVSCTVTKEVIKEVPVEVVKTEYKTEYIHDSIYQHDSTYIYMKGDTVFKTVDKLKYIERRVHDTLITHDTVPQIINTETTKIVTKNKPQWWPVWLSLGIIVLYFLITKTKFIIKLKEFIKYIINIFR